MKIKKFSIKVTSILFVLGTIIFVNCHRNKPPDVPSAPSGPDNGFLNAPYNFTVATADPDGDNISYQFDWGNDDTSNWSDFEPSETGVTMSKSWSDSATYPVKARAKDIKGIISDWSGEHLITISSDQPPNTPESPIGPDTGWTGVIYNFTVSTTDPDGDSLCYQFDWGDSDTSDWSDLVPSETVVTMSKSWSSPATYSVKARAKDVKGAFSEWSNIHSILIDTGYPKRVVKTIPVGSWPIGLAALPNGNYIYVANASDDNVSVIQTLDNTVVATIPVGAFPTEVAALPNGNFVYVTNYYNANVSVIRTSDNTVVDTIPVGTNPRGLAVLPDGNYVYVTNEEDDSVSVIRTSDNTVVATIPVGDYPTDVAVLPNGEYAYVTNTNDNNVSVILTSNNTVVATIPVGTQPRGVVALPNSDYVYVTNADDDNVSVVLTADNRVVNTIGVGDFPRGLAVLPGGSYVYVTNANDDNVSIIRTSNQEVVKTISVEGYPRDAAVLPDGSLVYVTNYDSATVSVIGW